MFAECVLVGVAVWLLWLLPVIIWCYSWNLYTVETKKQTSL